MAVLCVHILAVHTCTEVQTRNVAKIRIYKIETVSVNGTGVWLRIQVHATLVGQVRILPHHCGTDL